ncbi:Uncharacterized conserved protein, MAPEG superfamily [Roseovarius marisflavi]|uniref:Uncharacterized conserved protein, MAPEG superfamily n=1 Tax=Roseovarius marisflavi TaxID=1054996 RepID=A0A1M7C559_9RHOB|nr:MAPEG family protein [Roseovarius marisflavi]SHL61989.1 Uncharacterized conserved protein, MAPEG superfamily [Roseovarius marisflavi]
MVFWILAGLGAYLLTVYLPAMILFAQIGLRAYTGPRDTLPDPGVRRARALRAASNFQEHMPVFLGLGLLAMLVPGADMAQAALGAEIFVLSRLVYVAIYVSGLPMVRSVVFAVGFVGLVMMALSLS